ncbi:Xaa-Pro dipeptidyl-peptidase [Winogradskyella sp. UBA3174]|uniref:Xaa-Pro dipeptidyl-peptidase n=1 Tax=Winogradskyella sp. UBA3174 TaxID=1947785 RepID=UPI0025E9864C|nr:Xaa-Pro dipeptidyl-peptidase [Winogradskyella sp. UBA3174]|tara:strand:- start:2098 stop:3948 length:1851 start_codon:yes stop_codon:yes gene_type:complete
MSFKSNSILFFVFAFSILSLAQNATEKAQPIFKDGEAQIVEAFNNPKKYIRHDLWVETEFDTDGDGKPDRMHVDVTRPEQTETEGLKLPVVYESSPYFAGVAADAPGTMWNVEHELGGIGEERFHPEVTRRGKRPIISNSQIRTWVPRGYIVVHSSSPGTGLSDGAPTIGGKNESLAPKAVIDWLCGRAKGYKERDGNEEVKAFWSTGKVGMTGTSYNGTIPLAAATTGVKGLEAIIPIAPNTSYYHYYRSNGLVRSPGGYLGEDIDVLYDFVHSGDEDKRAYNNKTVRDTEMMNGMDRQTGDLNEFWSSRDYLNQMDNMEAALLMSHGFNDWNVMPEHSYRIYKAAKEKGLSTQVYYHQNGHGGPPPMSMMNRWFTKYLHGIDNGVEKEENKAYIVREYDDRQKPTAYKDYPNPEAKDVTFYPFLAGALDPIKPKSIASDTFSDNVEFSGSDLAKAKKSNNRLLYVTSTLNEDLHISGVAKVSITLASSKSAANLSVWMISLPWQEGKDVKITDNIITRGWADPKNHKSLTDEEDLVPGQFYTVNFELQPDDQIIKAGQQIGFMIFSSDKEYTLHPKAGTELTIQLNKTSLTLPVVGGERAFNKSTSPIAFGKKK